MVIIYPPTLNWEWMQQRPQQLMRAFARAGHTVWYYQHTPSGAPPREVEPNLWVVANPSDLPPGHERRLLWISWAKTASWIDRVAPDFTVYDCLDDFPDWRAAEQALIPRVDAVMASAQTLAARMREAHSSVTLVPNGVWPEHWKNVTSSPPIPAARDPLRPKWVYSGAVATWWDDGWFLEAARYAEIYVLGPAFGHTVPHHPHVHVLGLQPYAALPGYLAQMEAGLIPFRRYGVTEATNPVKLYEYLAAGLPVISTPLPETLCWGAPVWSVAAADIGEAAGRVRGWSRERVRPYAEPHSWGARYATIREALLPFWDRRGWAREEWGKEAMAV